MIKVAQKTLPFLLLTFLMFNPLNGFCQTSSLLKKGMEEYKDESYEEATKPCSHTNIVTAIISRCIWI